MGKEPMATLFLESVCLTTLKGQNFEPKSTHKEIITL
jgi:hypothetical protein